MAKDEHPLNKLKKKLKPKELERELVKNARINIRISQPDKTSMVAMAKRCNMTVTEYLVRLHQIALEKLGEKVPKKK